MTDAAGTKRQYIQVSQISHLQKSPVWTMFSVFVLIQIFVFLFYKSGVLRKLQPVEYYHFAQIISIRTNIEMNL